jgi:hypothetical protein
MPTATDRGFADGSEPDEVERRQRFRAYRGTLPRHRERRRRILPAGGTGRPPHVDGVSRALSAKRPVLRHAGDIVGIAAGDYPAGPGQRAPDGASRDISWEGRP